MRGVGKEEGGYYPFFPIYVQASSYDAKTNHTKQNKNNVKLNDKTKQVFFDQIITISGVDEKYKANKFDCSQM